MSFSEDSHSSLALLEQELNLLLPLPPDPEFCLRMERRMQQAMAARPTTSAGPAREENRPLMLPFSQMKNDRNLAPRATVATPLWRRKMAWAAAAAVTAAASAPMMLKSRENGSGLGMAQNGVAETTHERLQKVRARRQMQTAREEGIIMDPQEGAMRSIRFQFNNDYEIESSGGQKLGYQFPSEERMMIPVKFH